MWITLPQVDHDDWDAPLLALMHKAEGDLHRFLYAFFSFLSRRTVFYQIAPDAENLILETFRKFALNSVSRKHREVKNEIIGEASGDLGPSVHGRRDIVIERNIEMESTGKREKTVKEADLGTSICPPKGTSGSVPDFLPCVDDYISEAKHSERNEAVSPQDDQKKKYIQETSGDEKEPLDPSHKGAIRRSDVDTQETYHKITTSIMPYETRYLTSPEKRTENHLIEAPTAAPSAESSDLNAAEYIANKSSFFEPKTENRKAPLLETIKNFFESDDEERRGEKEVKSLTITSDGIDYTISFTRSVEVASKDEDHAEMTKGEVERHGEGVEECPELSLNNNHGTPSLPPLDASGTHNNDTNRETEKCRISSKENMGSAEINSERPSSKMKVKNSKQEREKGGKDKIPEFRTYSSRTDRFGNQYKGEFYKGKRDGKGSITYATSNDKYDGCWKDGRKNGEGTYKYADGCGSFQGVWKKGHLLEVKRGFAKVVDDDGNKYRGTFLRGKKHGSGTLTKPCGERYIGGWHDDMRHGFGLAVFPDGSSFQGMFKNDKPVKKQGKSQHWISDEIPANVYAESEVLDDFEGQEETRDPSTEECKMEKKTAKRLEEHRRPQTKQGDAVNITPNLSSLDSTITYPEILVNEIKSTATSHLTDLSSHVDSRPNKNSLIYDRSLLDSSSCSQTTESRSELTKSRKSDTLTQSQAVETKKGIASYKQKINGFNRRRSHLKAWLKV